MRSLIVLLSVCLATASANAQSEKENVEWLNKHSEHFKKGAKTRYLYSFTGEYILYKGISFEGKRIDDTMIRFNWSDIEDLEIGHAHVSETLWIKGKGFRMTKDGDEPLYTDSYSFELGDNYSNLKIHEILKRLKDMVKIKRSAIEQ